jgi:hypothetical protein
MKKPAGFSSLILLITFFISCSKKDSSQDTPKKNIQVLEYKTNLPIVGALVEYFTPCPGCAFQPAYNRVFNKNTGYDGICEIPESIFNNDDYGILITPPSPPQDGTIRDYDYWPTGSAGTHSTATTYYIPTLGEERLHLIKNNAFPKGFYMDIKAAGELSSFQVIDIARVYGFPSDTSIDFYTYRIQTNTITWKIYDSTETEISGGGPIMIDFPKTGKKEVELKY